MPVEQEIYELIPAFAIDATDSEESQRIKQYLVENPSATAELAEFAQLADALLFASPSAKAPEIVESRLLAAIAEPVDIFAKESAPRRTTESAVATAPAQGNIPWWKRIFTPALAPQWALSFAALALMVLLNNYWMRQVDRLQQTQAMMEAKLLQQETTLSVIAMDDTQRTVLPAVDGVSPAKADVIWGEGFEVALLYVEEFPQPEPGKVFQLWLIKDGKRTSGGLFTVNEHGTGTLVIQLDQPLDRYESMGITAEPEGGSEGPTSPPIVRGPIEG